MNPSAAPTNVAGPVRRDEGVASNGRLTASLGAALLVLLAVEGLTLVSLESVLRWHELIGVLLIPPILLKLGTTGYRFARYYTGDEAYGRKGPPHWVLRLTAPGMVLLTIAMFASGVVLALERRRQDWIFFTHKVSFILWFGAMSVHVLGHVRETATAGTADWRPGVSRPSGTNARRAALVSSLVAGAVAAAVLSSRFVR